MTAQSGAPVQQRAGNPPMRSGSSIQPATSVGDKRTTRVQSNTATRRIKPVLRTSGGGTHASRPLPASLPDRPPAAGVRTRRNTDISTPVRKPTACRRLLHPPRQAGAPQCRRPLEAMSHADGATAPPCLNRRTPQRRGTLANRSDQLPWISANTLTNSGCPNPSVIAGPAGNQAPHDFRQSPSTSALSRLRCRPTSKRMTAKAAVVVQIYRQEIFSVARAFHLLRPHERGNCRIHQTHVAQTSQPGQTLIALAKASDTFYPCRGDGWPPCGSPTGREAKLSGNSPVLTRRIADDPSHRGRGVFGGGVAAPTADDAARDDVRHCPSRFRRVLGQSRPSMRHCREVDPWFAALPVHKPTGTMVRCRLRWRIPVKRSTK